jgi:hypothetical protein
VIRTFFFIISLSSFLWAGAKNTTLGYSGIIVTPTAQILNDGELTGNLGRLPKLYANNYSPKNYNRTAFVTAMGFFPFLEASFGFIRPDNFQGGVGDRTVTLRLKVLNERQYIPAVAIGFHDFFAVESLDLEPAAAQHFAALYLVTTKQFTFSTSQSLLVSLGYGPDWLPADDSHLQGLFGGVQYSPIENVQLLAEHDTKNLNVGMRFSFFSHLNYSMSFWQLRYMMHQLSFSFSLY